MNPTSLQAEPATPTLSPHEQVVNDLPAHLRKPRLLRKDAAEYLSIAHGIKCAPRTLAKYACLGDGPPFQRQGRIILYPRELLDQWASARLSAILRSTSDRGGAE